MKKVVDLTEHLEQKTESRAYRTACPSYATNPVYQKMAKFINAKLSEKFDVNDLFR